MRSVKFVSSSVLATKFKFVVHHNLCTTKESGNCTAVVGVFYTAGFTGVMLLFLFLSHLQQTNSATSVRNSSSSITEQTETPMKSPREPPTSAISRSIWKIHMNKSSFWQRALFLAPGLNRPWPRSTHKNGGQPMPLALAHILHVSPCLIHFVVVLTIFPCLLFIKGLLHTRCRWLEA